MGKRRTSNNTEVNEKSWLVISSIFLITMAALLFFAYRITLYGDIGSSWKRPEIILAVLLVLGVVVLLLSLAFTSVIFKSLGLSDRNQSLGLPEGSVRAVIALSLILIFMMSAVFIYMEVDRPVKYISTGITKEMLDEMPKENIVSISLNETKNNESLYDVILIVKKDTASTDLAKQIVTTMSTLVVAVAAFYFGTKSVLAARGATEEPDETPAKPGVTPDKAMLGDELDLRIVGEYLDSAKDVKLVQGSVEIPTTNVKVVSSSLVTCHVKIPPEGKPTGKYTVLIIHTDGEEMRLDDAFTVNPKAG